MTRYLWTLVASLLYATPLIAETRYISDEFRVPLRSSPCSTCAIIHRGLKSGLALTFIEEQKDWSHVKTADGLDGWMPSQYIVSEPIARLRVERAEEHANVLQKKYSELQEQVASLERSNIELSLQAETLKNRNQAIHEELAMLKKVSSSALELQQQNQELLKRNKMLQSDMDILTARAEQLQAVHTQKWFLYGALAVFMGALLSVLIPRLKRKRGGYSEWA